MNRKMRRAIAFKKRAPRKQTDANAEIFRDVMLTNTAKPRNRERKEPKGYYLKMDRKHYYPTENGREGAE